MKFAFYEVVSSESEKKERLRTIKETYGKSPDYFSSYLEVAQIYNASRGSLRALHSMRAAIRKGKIDTVVIKSISNLRMEERRAYELLMTLMDNGINIALREPGKLLTREEIRDLVEYSRLNYIISQLIEPIMDGQMCTVSTCAKSTYIKLLDDEAAAKIPEGDTKMPFIDAVNLNFDRGFYIYRSDIKTWYHINQFMASAIIYLHEEIMKRIWPF